MKKKIVVSIVVLFVFAIVFFLFAFSGDGSEIPITSPLDVHGAVRTKEFELAYQASQEIAQLEFPSNMKRVQEVLAHIYSPDQLALFSS